MKTYSLLLLLVLFAVIITSNTKKLKIPTDSKLLWSEEFNELNQDTWEHEITLGGGGNWEFQYYTNNRTNSYVKNGNLYLRPTLTADTIGEDNVWQGYTMDLWGSMPSDMCTGNAWYGCERRSFGRSGGNIINPIQSARIRSVKSFSMKYGRVEVRAKMPRGDWLWPAIWMMPKHAYYGNWPASGEIDIVESRGNMNMGEKKGVYEVTSALHWGPFWSENRYHLTYGELGRTHAEGDFGSRFFTYTLVRNENEIATFVDGRKIMSVPITEPFWEKGGFNTRNGLNNPWVGRPKNAPFDTNFYFILNVAVGGVQGYFPDTIPGKPWRNSSPNAVNDFYRAKDQWFPTWKGEECAMVVDYIRVYDK